MPVSLAGNYDVDLGPSGPYTTDPANPAETVDDRYSGNAANARTDLPGLDAYWDFMALSNPDYDDTHLLALNYFCAAWLDAFWQTDGFFTPTAQTAYPNNGSQSRANLILPPGGYLVNYPLLFSYGQYTGKGSANYTDLTQHVGGAGTAAVNGDYYLDGEVNGRPRFTLTTGAQPLDSIYWDGTKWIIQSGGVSMYQSTDDVTYPYKVTTWTVTGGAGPVPTVSYTGSTWGTQLIVDHTYWLTDLRPDLNLMQAISFGDTSNAGYTEGTQIEHIRFEGMANDLEATVAGAGTAAVNGTYYLRQTKNGRARFTLTGQSTDGYSIYVTANIWSIYNAGTEMYRQSTTTTGYLYPWQVPSWVAVSGAAPAPTVTGGLWDNSYRSSGIAMWSMGSASCISHCFARNFNDYGILLADKSTPATLINITSFLNNLAAIGIEGAGGMVTCYGIEADDNPAIYYAVANNTYSPGSPCSVSLQAFGTKSETGPAEARPFPKGQCLADMTGWTNLQFVGVQYSSVFLVPELFIRINATTNTSYVSVDGLRIFGSLSTALHDVVNDTKYLIDGDRYGTKYQSRGHSFKFNTGASGTKGAFESDFVVFPELTDCTYTGRLAWLTVNNLGQAEGTWNDQAGTPPYVL